MTNEIEIIEISNGNIHDFITQPESFEVFGRIDPTYSNGRWTYIEVLFEERFEKMYDTYDEKAIEQYVLNNDKTAFFIYLNGEAAGRILVEKNWNGYCYIVDIFIKKQFKQKGLGKELLKKSIDWSKQNYLSGVMVETQDINLTACRFYKNLGFEIGGLDKFLYDRRDDTINKEVAVFWYYLND